MGTVALQPKDQFITQFKKELGSESVKQQFKSVLKDKANGFIVSLMNFYVDNATNTKAFEPMSVIKSALTAATLDLPIDKNLGFAYLVPYEFKGSGLNQVNFQLGYKGYIQLAQRTGQYKRLSAAPVYEEHFVSWNPITEELITDYSEDADYNKKPYGYVFYFKLNNGFEKTIFKKHAEIEAHARKHSSGYRAYLEKKARSSIWVDNFEAMALKTVIKEGISKWGIMSVDIQKAIEAENEEGEAEKVKKEISQSKVEPIDITEGDTQKEEEKQNIDVAELFKNEAYGNGGEIIENSELPDFAK